jgi:hypothetical protein
MLRCGGACSLGISRQSRLVPLDAMQKCIQTNYLRHGQDIAESWGIRKGNANLFASGILLRPHRIQKNKQTTSQDGAERENQTDNFSNQACVLRDLSRTLN